MEDKEFIEYTSDYKIVSADSVEELTKKVKTILFAKDNEWEPNGGPFAFDGKVHQNLIKTDEDEI